MSYYHHPTLTERHPGRHETKLSDGATLSPPETGWTPELAALCGFVVVVNTARPADTATDTSDRSVVWNGTTATETWTVRPKTQAELDADTADTNSATIRQRAATALAGNSTFLADPSVTNAEAVTQLRALTRQVNGLIRLTINALDDITDS